MNEQRTISTLAHAVDVVPTLLDMVGATKPDSLKFDGVSLKGLFDPTVDVDWAERYVVTDSQRVRDPIKWKTSSVMSQGWRLINGEELYNVESDPGQTKDVAGDHADRVAKMRDFYEGWWAELEPTFAQTTEIYLGHEDHPVVTMTGHDWIQNGLPPWNQGHIRAGNSRQKANAKHEGHWAVKVLETGMYTVSARRWPVEADHPITASLPAGENVPGASKAYRANDGVSVAAVKATLRLDGKDIETKAVSGSDKQITFTVELEKGSHQLAPCFIIDDGSELGAYYATVTRLK